MADEVTRERVAVAHMAFNRWRKGGTAMVDCLCGHTSYAPSMTLAKRRHARHMRQVAKRMERLGL